MKIVAIVLLALLALYCAGCCYVHAVVIPRVPVWKAMDRLAVLASTGGMKAPEFHERARAEFGRAPEVGEEVSWIAADAQRLANSRAHLSAFMFGVASVGCVVGAVVVSFIRVPPLRQRGSRENTVLR